MGLQNSWAQYVYKIKADTVRIYNTCDTAELVLQNRTQNVAGFLYNKGQGVTEFRSLNDNFIQNQGVAEQPANFNISGFGNVGGVLNVAGGYVNLNNPDGNFLLMGGGGVAKPALVKRSTGTRIVLYPSMNAGPTFMDHAIGMEPGHIWLATATNDTANGFRFYGGITPIGQIDGKGSTEWAGMGRFKGWYTSGTGPALETGILTGSAVVQAYDRDVSSYIPLRLSGGGAVLRSMTIDEVGYQFNGFVNKSLLGTDANGYLKDVSATENLNTIMHRDNTTDASIVINPHGNAFRSLLVYRDSDTSVTYTTFGNNRTAATITFIPDTSKISKAYNISVGAGTLTYYNAGQSENIWRSSNHVPGDTFNVSTTAGSVLSSIITNASGHVKSVTKRTLTPADIGAAPSADYVSRTADTTDPQQANVYVDDLNKVTNTAIFHVNNLATNAPVSGVPGYVLSMGNNKANSIEKGQLLLSYNIDDGFFYRMGSNTSWNAWYRVASRTWSNTNLIQNQVASAQHAFFNIDSSGTAKLFSAYNSVTGGNAGFSVQSGGGIRYFINIYNGKMLIGGNGMWPGTAPITIAYAGLDSGNVGINTPSPTAKLHVTVMSNTQQSLYLDQKGSNLIVAPSSGGGTVTKIDNTLGGLALQASTGAGNMGIGRGPTTYAKLSVLGVISSAQGGFQLDSVYTESPMRIYSNNGSGHIDFSAHSASTNKFGVSMYVPDNTGDFRIQTAPVVAGTGTLSYTDRVTVLNSGKVGIGTTAPATMLDVVGDIHASGAITATSITQTSLRSLKKEIKPFTASALNILDSAQVRTFIFKADSTNTTRIGFIADEVPDAMAATGRKGVEETNTVALLVKAIQEMKAEMDAMKEKVSQVNALEQRVHDLEIQLKKKNK